MKTGWLSYNILKAQRNEYICAMTVYVSLALMIYVGVLNYTYRKRDKWEE